MSGKKRNVMLFVLLFTLLLGVIVPVQAQSYGGTKTIRVAYREDADFINKSSSGVYKGYGVESVSYTHLDVYKRQAFDGSGK